MEDFYVEIEYDAQYGPDSLRAVFEAIREAVRQNWLAHYDRLSEPVPSWLVDIEDWLDRFDVTKLKDSFTEYKRSEEDGFSYSALSAWVARFEVRRYPDGGLGLQLIWSHHIRHESGKERYRMRLEASPAEEMGIRGAEPPPEYLADPLDPFEYLSERYLTWAAIWFGPMNAEVWPRNRQCIRNILAHLRAALPVKSMTVDPVFRDEGDEDGAG